MASAVAKGEGNPLMIVGAKTGRDGIHGATFASEEISEASESKRPSVQIGDPFMEKLLLEATLEIINEGLIVGIQDMGAAGITCSTSEMSAKGKCGVIIDIDRVPVRESGMTPYEILLSESQERMLVCVKHGNEHRVKEIFDKWGLDSETIGYVTCGNRMVVKYHGEIVSDIPSDSLVLGGGAPVYVREQIRPAYVNELNTLDLNSIPQHRDWNETLVTLLGSPNICHKGWVFEQYDSMIRTSTVVGPGSDAAVLRIRHTDTALAMTTDCNGRYCYLDPRVGASSAVAEAARNIVCSGGKPLAITNCLNFGNPYKPEIYYQFAEAIAGMGESCRAFETPVTGGNVSFYNEDPQRAVFPTPTIGMIGIVESLSHITTQWFKDDGDVVLLLGDNSDHLGASEYLHTVCSMTRGTVPPLDLNTETRLQSTLLSLIKRGLVKSAHDCSEGGIAVALAECCIANQRGQIGAKINLGDSMRTDALLFGETQSRVIISVAPERVADVENLCRQAGQSCHNIGVVGGDSLVINNHIACTLSRMSDAWYNTLGRIMERVS
jgi:phosphoribosylformylglycinamidine synthase